MFRLLEFFDYRCEDVGCEACWGEVTGSEAETKDYLHQTIWYPRHSIVPSYNNASVLLDPK